MRAWGLVLVAACGAAAKPKPAPAPSPEPAPAPEPEEVLCAKYGMGMIGMTAHSGGPTPVDDAFTIAHDDIDKAIAASDAGDDRAAARHYIDCGHRFAAVQAEGDDDMAFRSAEVCYQNAMWSFANANALAREGKAALEAAAVADPREAKYIRDLIANAPDDCAPSE